MKRIYLTVSLLIVLNSSFSYAEENSNQPSTAPAESAEKSEKVDISGLEEDYWRPNKDELEVVQNRRYTKANRIELAVHYGIYQGKDYVNSKSVGLSLGYNITDEFFVEVSRHNISNEENDLLKSFQARFGTAPEFNREKNQTVLSTAWVPIYAKFSLLGKKISHFEMFFAPGIGITKTAKSNVSGHFTIGQKFFVTEHVLFRIDWRMSRYTDRVTTTQGATSLANGGPGYIDSQQTTHNIIFGLGWMF
ncbi:MAG: outer membrane beta-barrel domain-containing protein [Oligoflexia bacterium]|nr:outer membrane beta-barrel domain-containing protein [Oligoflexia bacterium]